MEVRQEYPWALLKPAHLQFPSHSFPRIPSCQSRRKRAGTRKRAQFPSVTSCDEGKWLVTDQTSCCRGYSPISSNCFGDFERHREPSGCAEFSECWFCGTVPATQTRVSRLNSWTQAHLHKASHGGASDTFVIKLARTKCGSLATAIEAP